MLRVNNIISFNDMELSKTNAQLLIRMIGILILIKQLLRMFLFIRNHSIEANFRAFIVIRDWTQMNFNEIFDSIIC